MLSLTSKSAIYSDFTSFHPIMRTRKRTRFSKSTVTGALARRHTLFGENRRETPARQFAAGVIKRWAKDIAVDIIAAMLVAPVAECPIHSSEEPPPTAHVHRSNSHALLY